jgi:hypothetical protein
VDPQEAGFLPLLVHGQLLHVYLVNAKRELPERYQREVDRAFGGVMRLELVPNGDVANVSSAISGSLAFAEVQTRAGQSLNPAWW